MVIYAQRVRLGKGTFGVASGAPVKHGQPCAPAAQGMTLPCGSAVPMVTGAPVQAAAWLRRGDVAVVRPFRSGTPGTLSTPNTIKRDAFAGVSPGPRDTSPPV